MNPKIGPSLWNLLHTFADSLPDTIDAQDLKKVLLFMNGWEHCLAAAAKGECQCHAEWRKLTGVCPIKPDTREEFVAWVTAAHDWVNEKLGKPVYSASSYEHAIFKRLRPPVLPQRSARSPVVHTGAAVPCSTCS